MFGIKKSQEMFELACRHIPGGVNSPVRAFKGVGGTPIFFEKAQGAYFQDVDGNEYIDYVGSWGTAIAGHANSLVVQKISEVICHGLSFGAPNIAEHKLAELIKSMMPHIDQIRMVNSGTEATMSAVRLARGYTKRDKIIKFEGCYHGHYDGFLVKAGSGGLTYGIPDSAGVPKAIADLTLTATYNDIDSVAAIFNQYKSEVAAVIVEPIAANMNCVLPKASFLQNLRKLCDQNGALLIFDEVITGFRVHPGGAAVLYEITPDLVTLGKIIGGGLPVGAFGGKQEIMRCLAPLGDVYQAGTLSGNPIAMSAGYWTLMQLNTAGFHQNLNDYTEQLCHGISELAAECKISLVTTNTTGLFGIFFTDQKTIETLNDVKKCSLDDYRKFFHGMCQEGIYMAPSMYEAGFVSSAHGNNELKKTLNAVRNVFEKWERG